jgi:hypothetical protein
VDQLSERDVVAAFGEVQVARVQRVLDRDAKVISPNPACRVASLCLVLAAV